MASAAAVSSARINTLAFKQLVRMLELPETQEETAALIGEMIPTVLTTPMSDMETVYSMGRMMIEQGVVEPMIKMLCAEPFMDNVSKIDKVAYAFMCLADTGDENRDLLIKKDVVRHLFRVWDMITDMEFPPGTSRAVIIDVKGIGHDLENAIKHLTDCTPAGLISKNSSLISRNT